MKTFFSNFALVDVGASKVALVVPQLSGGTNAAARSVAARCCIVEPVEAGNLSSSSSISSSIPSEIARAEAFRRARNRAEAMVRTRLRRVFLLANEPSLKLVPPAQERHHNKDSWKKASWDKSQQETIVVNAAATDRNKRPLSFYAMDKRRWQFYARLASYAGVSIVGFVFPAVALGQSLLVHRRTLAAVARKMTPETKTKTKAGTRTEDGEGGIELEHPTNEQSFVVLDIGSHTTGVAVFTAGVPCACQSWEFGTASITATLAESFSLTRARAATLQRSLVFSEDLLESLLDPSSRAATPALSERRFPRKDAFLEKTQHTSQLGATTHAATQQGAMRVVVSAYGSLFAEVARFLKRSAPQLSSLAPVYATGGGSLIAGSHVLASHLLTRYVLPYPCLGARTPTRGAAGVASRAFGERIAAVSALACLSVLSRGGMGMPASTILSSMSPWSRRLKIFSLREPSRDSFPFQPEESSHA